MFGHHNKMSAQRKQRSWSLCFAQRGSSCTDALNGGALPMSLLISEAAYGLVAREEDPR